MKSMTKNKELISKVMNVDVEEIGELIPLKTGMTNRSFKFGVDGKEYILRSPGEGTEKLINRENEAKVYEKLKGRNISDRIVYISGEDGYKITEYWEDARVCDPLDKKDVKMCMDKLREFHDLKLEVDHSFNLFEEIDFYESLWEGQPSMYEDYKKTKENVLKLKKFIDSIPKERILTHIDSNSDNLLIVDGEVFMIDWEYAGMQDPDLDIAMFALYALYDREQTDFLIDSYFVDGCTEETRMKIYAYMSIAGLLWSNWCEYKKMFDIDFGDYAIKQYDYARDYYNIVNEEFIEKSK